MTAYPSEWSVRRARDAYLERNGFDVASYDRRWTTFKVGPVPFGVPNTRRHRWAIMLHDLHHVATGYGTDLAGEGEVSAWELRRGIRHLGPYVGSIVVGGALMGLLVSPRRTLAAWRASGATRATLFDPRSDYESLLDETVDTLRQRLAVN